MKKKFIILYFTFMIVCLRDRAVCDGVLYRIMITVAARLLVLSISLV